MEPEQALEILNAVANLAAKNGGVYQNVQEAYTANLALNTFENMIKKSNNSKDNDSKEHLGFSE